MWLRELVENAMFDQLITEEQYREYNGLSTWTQMSRKAERDSMIIIRYSEQNGLFHYKASYGNLSVAGTANSLEESEKLSLQMSAEFKVPYATIHKVYDGGKPVKPAEGNINTHV
jgi:hypothetical protein